MGLGQDPKHIAYWWLPAVGVASSGMLELTGEPGRALLKFDRAAILNAEFWRLFSGHFVHLNFGHFVLNAFGLILVWLLVGTHFTIRQWLLVILVSVVGVDCGLWFFDAELSWYVGMSGLLHAMLAAGVVKGVSGGSRLSTAVGITVLIKIAYEQLLGPLPGSEQSAGGDVVVNAHLYGVLSGACAAAVIMRGHFARHKNGE